MHTSMLCSPNIQIYRHPILRLFFGKYFLLILRVTISQEIPRRIYESVQGIRLSPSFSRTFWTFNIKPFIISLQRISLSKLNFLRQFNRLSRELEQHHTYHNVSMELESPNISVLLHSNLLTYN